MRTDVNILISALKILSDEILSDDGVANAVILESSMTMRELYEENKALKGIIEAYNKKSK
jgi:hypothetical protein